MTCPKIWKKYRISHTGERIMLCCVPGGRGVKEESAMKSQMMQELRLMKAVVAFEVPKFWKGFGCSMNRCVKQLLGTWGQTFFSGEELALVFQWGSVRICVLGSQPEREWMINVREICNFSYYKNEVKLCLKYLKLLFVGFRGSLLNKRHPNSIICFSRHEKRDSLAWIPFPVRSVYFSPHFCLLPLQHNSPSFFFPQLFLSCFPSGGRKVSFFMQPFICWSSGCYTNTPLPVPTMGQAGISGLSVYTMFASRLANWL